MLDTTIACFDSQTSRLCAFLLHGVHGAHSRSRSAHTRDFRYPAKTTTTTTFPTHKILHFLRPNPLELSLRNLERQVVALIFLHRPLCTALNLNLLPFFAPIKLATHTHSVELFPHFFPGCAAPCIFLSLGLAWLLLMVSPFFFSCSARAAHVNSDLSTTTVTTAAAASIFTL